MMRQGDRFADDIIIISQHKHDIKEMLEKLDTDYTGTKYRNSAHICVLETNSNTHKRMPRSRNRKTNKIKLGSIWKIKLYDKKETAEKWKKHIKNAFFL